MIKLGKGKQTRCSLLGLKGPSHVSLTSHPLFKKPSPFLLPSAATLPQTSVTLLSLQLTADLFAHSCVCVPSRTELHRAVCLLRFLRSTSVSCDRDASALLCTSVSVARAAGSAAADGWSFRI